MHETGADTPPSGAARTPRSARGSSDATGPAADADTGRAQHAEDPQGSGTREAGADKPRGSASAAPPPGRAAGTSDRAKTPGTAPSERGGKRAVTPPAGRAADAAKAEKAEKADDGGKRRWLRRRKGGEAAPVPLAPSAAPQAAPTVPASAGEKPGSRSDGAVPVLAPPPGTSPKPRGRSRFGLRRAAVPEAAAPAKRGPRHAAGPGKKPTGAAERPGRHRKAGGPAAPAPAGRHAPAPGAGRHRKAGPEAQATPAKPTPATPQAPAQTENTQPAKPRTAEAPVPAQAGAARRRRVPAPLFIALQILLLGLPGIGSRLGRRVAFRVAPRLAGRLGWIAVAVRAVRLARRHGPAVRARAKAAAKARRARKAKRSGRRATRHQRLALRTRRWETLAAVATVTATVVAGLLATGPDDAGVREARSSSDIADGVSRPGAVDAPGAAPDAGSTADLGAVGQPSAFVAPPLARSVPERIHIPQLGTDVEVFGAALGTDGGPPSPAEEDAMRAAWYSGGVSPGEQGAAIVVGHLDTYTGPAAFAGLGQLRPGENIEIEREDGQTAVFTVDSVEQYPKSDFPDERVYGAVGTPQLRLITCGGRWTQDGGYDSNIVAYARLTGTLPPPMTSDSSQEQAGVPGVNGA
ncbi:class F sortase [Streptomyces sp. MS19]|uniref:class F sortase n=1 Tax=Streptomyces sp. MS19 TaxID=3385972 RepID=UPI0039A18881